MLEAGRRLVNWGVSLVVDPRRYWHLAFLVLAGDAVLTQIIIRSVSYTEIDWETYMFQIGLIKAGERNYTKISGPTGRLVYPAGHVHIHKLLASITNNGLDVRLAQQIYAFLYLASLSLSILIYARARAPNWALLILPLSKRLHSIFVLRLFNDCWATTIMQAAVLAFSSGYDLLGIIMFSLALSVKMSILLYFPAVAILLLKRRGLLPSLGYFSAVLGLQAGLASQFLIEFPWEYIKGSFDFSRQFLYKWTVNWKMMSEETFLSPRLSYGLLVCHAMTLLLVGHHYWCRTEGGIGQVIISALRHPFLPTSSVTVNGEEIVNWLFTCNLVGITFSRSLHYQFYSWYAHQLPYFISKSRCNFAIKFVAGASIEYAWNIFPATCWSSTILFICNVFFVLVMLPVQNPNL